MADDDTKNKQDPDDKSLKGGTDPKKTDTSNDTFDPSKIGDEDFDKIFDDPRVWKHPRFKSLNDKARKAAEFETEAEKRKEKELAEQKKFQELATKAQTERDEWKTKFQQSHLNATIQAAAAKIGVVDMDAISKLVDRTAITFDEATNTYSGVEEAIDSLLTAKPFLKGQASQPNIGSGTNPGDGAGTQFKRFKLSQLQDPAFYRENEKDITIAYQRGLIEDDMPSAGGHLIQGVKQQKSV